MLAVDTNIVVRYLTLDDPKQSPRARALVDSTDVFVAITVVLETEWVLRRLYHFNVPRIVDAMREFAGLPHVTLESPELVSQALNWAEHGMDFADALHLARARDCQAFVSFDEPLAKTARRVGAMVVRTP